MIDDLSGVLGDGARVGMDLAADIDISVDGPRGHATAQLLGSGRRLVLRTDRPEAVFAATGRRSGAALARTLAAAGLHAEVHGPRGPVVAVEPDRTSRAGAVMVGDPHLDLGRAGWSTLARTAQPLRLGSARGRALAVLFTAAAAAGAAAVVVVRRHRGRHRSRRGRCG